jgi:NO-binding membrane sensor protein with MHYT domain
MSRTAKVFLATSVLVTGLTVWGVHFIQAREEEVRLVYTTRSSR